MAAPRLIIKENFFCYYIICDIQLNNLYVVSEHDWVNKFLDEHVSENFYVYIKGGKHSMKTNIPNFLNQEELLELAENVKYFRAQNHMSVKQLAAEMQRPISFIQSIENGSHISSQRDVDDLADCLDVPPELLRKSLAEIGPEEFIDDMVHDYIERAVSLIEDCDASECEFILGIIPSLGITYRKGGLFHYKLKYEVKEPKFPKDDCWPRLAEHFKRYNNRECAVLTNCIEQIVLQIKSGASTIDVYFPELAVDLNDSRKLFYIVN